MNNISNMNSAASYSNRSKRALSHYLNDLVSPQTEQSDLDEQAVLVNKTVKTASRSQSSELEISTHERSQLQRLLDRSNDLDFLINDQAESESRLNSADHSGNMKEASIQAQAFAEKITEDNKVLQKNAEILETPLFTELAIRDTKTALVDALPNRFQVLICKIAELTLAIPLVELGGIHQISKIKPIVGKPKWFKGMLLKGEHKYQCIDVMHWLNPKRFASEAKRSDQETQEHYKFAIQLGKTPYVICCDSVSTTIEVEKTDVRWRQADGNRLWLAGVLKERMCALIDAAAIVTECIQQK